MLPPTNTQVARGATAGHDSAPARRRIALSLLLTGGLLACVALFQAWTGLRLAGLEHRLEAERSAASLAARVALAMQREDARVRRLLAEDPAASSVLNAAPSSPQARTQARQLFAEHLSAEVDLRTPPASGAGAVGLTSASVFLAPGEENPVLVHVLSANGARLLLQRDCGHTCRPAPPPGTVAVLSLGERQWPPASLPDDALITSRFEHPPTAEARIPHVGAVDWRIQVHREPSLAALPVLAATLLLVALAAIAGWQIWALTRARERALLREQERLAANERKLAAVLDSSAEGILMVDGQDRVALLNPAAEVMFGQLETDMLGKPLRVLLPDAGAPPAESAADERILDLEALRKGAAEPFPVRVSERCLRLDGFRYRLLFVQDLTEQQSQARQLAFLEQQDVMTGLLNRAEFERRMARTLSAAAGSGIPHVLCYIDIDQFKLINDTVGHAAGDALIAQLAKLIGVKLGDAVLLGRLGGDEFGALFAEHGETEVLSICDDLLQTVRNFLFTWRDHSFDVGISIGVTAFLPENESPEAELAKADVACHMAKSEGRGRIHVYRDSDAGLIRRHGEMHQVAAISRALNSGRFQLFAQPIAPIARGSGDPTHFEVLVRMLDEQGALVAPDAFIPAAERYILMPAVDRWIIQQLFAARGEALRQWHARHPEHFLYAVNVSATSINDEAFLPYLKRQFEVQNVPPSSICFELTETAAMRDVAHARRFIQSLTDLGCQFALDDFGSGLSSYGYLRELPVQYVKIDGSFVRGMDKDPVNYALVASINQVAHVLGLKTIAEWAENEYVINQLRAISVDYVQGYAVGPPTPIPISPVKSPLDSTTPEPPRSEHADAG